MSQRKCRLCRQTGHTINRCNSARYHEIITDFANRFETMQTHEVLFNYLNSLPDVEVAALAVHRGLITSWPSRELVDTLTRMLTRNQKSKRILWSNYIAYSCQQHPTLTLIEVFKKKCIDKCRIMMLHNTIDEAVSNTHEFITQLADTQPIDIRQDIFQGMVDAIVYIMENPGFADVQRAWSVGVNVAPTSTEPVEEDCPICFDSCDNKTLIRTNCNHHFCYSCISRHLDTFKTKETPQCAMCRGQIQSVLLFSESHTEEFERKYTRTEEALSVIM